MSAKVTNIITLYALQKRMQKMIEEIDKYFDDAEGFGLTLKESDPDGTMLKIRKSLVASLENEKRIGRLKP